MDANPDHAFWGNVVNGLTSKVAFKAGVNQGKRLKTEQAREATQEFETRNDDDKLNARQLDQSMLKEEL